MNTSGVGFESLMMEKLLQEEYADVAPSVNPGANEVYTYLFEAEQTYIEIMKALALEELKQTAFTQTPYVHEAENANKEKGIIARAIDAFIYFMKKLWNGIVSVWKWVTAKFDELIRSNDSFVKKYGKELDAIKNDTITYDGYDFANLTNEYAAPQYYNGGLSYNVLKDSHSANFKSNITAEELKDDYVLGLTVHSRLFEKYRSIISSPEDCNAVNFKMLYYGEHGTYKTTVADQLNIIRGLNNVKASYNIRFNGQNKLHKHDMEVFEKFKNSPENAANKHTIDEIIKFYRWMIPVHYMLTTQYSKALVACAQQARVICMKALREMNHESAIPTDNYNKKSINELLFSL